MDHDLRYKPVMVLCYAHQNERISEIIPRALSMSILYPVEFTHKNVTSTVTCLDTPKTAWRRYYRHYREHRRLINSILIDSCFD